MEITCVVWDETRVALSALIGDEPLVFRVADVDSFVTRLKPAVVRDFRARSPPSFVYPGENLGLAVLRREAPLAPPPVFPVVLAAEPRFHPSQWRRERLERFASGGTHTAATLRENILARVVQKTVSPETAERVLWEIPPLPDATDALRKWEEWRSRPEACFYTECDAELAAYAELALEIFDAARATIEFFHAIRRALLGFVETEWIADLAPPFVPPSRLDRIDFEVVTPQLAYEMSLAKTRFESICALVRGVSALRDRIDAAGLKLARVDEWSSLVACLLRERDSAKLEPVRWSVPSADKRPWIVVVRGDGSAAAATVAEIAHRAACRHAGLGAGLGAGGLAAQLEEEFRDFDVSCGRAPAGRRCLARGKWAATLVLVENYAGGELPRDVDAIVLGCAETVPLEFKPDEELRG